MLLVILTVKKLLEQEKELRVEKVIKRKSDKLYVGKTTIILLTVGLIQRT